MTGAGWMALWCQLLLLSLLQIGGALAVAPDLHRLLVAQLGLLSEAQFAASIAIAQASPGPNALYVAVLGYQVAGLAGAVAAQVALLLPSSLLAIVAARWGSARERRRAMQAFQAGMAPITIALLVATSFILVSQAPGWRAVALATASAAVLVRTRVHILWIIAAGAMAGAAGLV
jgi:chromate transporter